MRIDIVAAVPEILDSMINYSIVRNARDAGVVEIFVHNLHDYAADKFRHIDDYPFGGGEIPAGVLTDAIVRLLPGAMGHSESALNDSFMEGLLEAPQYTRPAEFRGMKVPEVLLSGDHLAIEKWRYEKALAKTRRRRPDMLED
ncbi:MAG: hypothetical protein ACOCX7_00590 [Bacteroidota bacterium]